MPKRITLTVLLIITVLIGFVPLAVAAPTKISGVLEWRYGSHTATENGTQVLDASHFTQKYSFLAEKKGVLASGRLGTYDLALGYEWSWVDSKRGNNVDVVIDNPLDKLLYRGELTLAPGGLPFNMHAYSYDMRSTTFVEEDLGEIFRSRGFSVSGNTVTNILNGSNRVTGLTLEVGVENGHYEGKYRNVLSSVPRLLIDFQQNDVYDVKSLTPRDYTDRNLAFVSLNKKNNWFHYSMFTHEDRIDSSTDYREQTFLLGTIDHHDRRQWINLTNWIKVSADVSYSETLPDDTTASRQFQKRYDINLFSKAQRTRWRGSNYTSYSRVSDENSLDRRLYIPLYASGELNRDTAWRARMVASRTESDLFSSGVSQQADDLYAMARIDTYRQSRYIFSPVVAAESKTGLDGEGYAVRAGAEFRTNSSYRSAYDLFGRYEARWFTGTGDTGQSVDYLEHLLEGKIEKDFSGQLRGGLTQKFLLANGSYDSTVADNIVAKTDGIINYKGVGNGTVFRSLTTFFADHRSLGKFNNRFELAFDYQSSPVLSGLQVVLAHRFSYRQKAWSVTTDSEIGTGDELATTSVGLGTGVENYFSNRTRVNYRPSRIVKTSLELEYEQRSFSTGSDTERYRVREIADYSIWKIAGLIRKLAVLGQEIELNKSLQDSLSVGDNYVAFTLFGNYYPTRVTLLSAKLRYEVDSIAHADTLIAYLTAGLDFRKLKISLDYSYGDRTSGVSAPQRTEHRWEVKVKKLF